MNVERIKEGGYTLGECPVKGSAGKAIMVALDDSDHGIMAKDAAGVSPGVQADPARH